MNDLQMLVAMLAKAGISFRVDSAHGWHRRIVLDGDRAFVFKTDHSLAGIRSEDDTQDFDGDS